MFNDRTQQVQAKQDGQTETGQEKRKQSGSGVGLSSVGYIMALQRSIGNRATTHLIQRMQANAPIQRMSDKDFNPKFAEFMGISAKNIRVMSQSLKLFKNWLKGRVENPDKLMVDEIIAQDDFTVETLQDYVVEFKEFQNQFGPMEKANDIADVPVPQGMYFAGSELIRPPIVPRISVDRRWNRFKSQKHDGPQTSIDRQQRHQRPHRRPKRVEAI